MPVSCKPLLLFDAADPAAWPNCRVPGFFLLMEADLAGAAPFMLAVVAADDSGTLCLVDAPLTPPVLLAARRAAAS